MILTLNNIINGCLRLSYFPVAWKKANIITILKPGKHPQLTDSYRPIAMLSSTSKLLEKVLLAALQIQMTSLILSEQAAFRREHSTTLQLTKLIDYIANNLNNRKHMAAVFLNVEKAFDRVWHDGLIYKMAQLKIDSNIILIIRSFLSNRYFNVKIEDHYSSPPPHYLGRRSTRIMPCANTLFNFHERCPNPLQVLSSSFRE